MTRQCRIAIGEIAHETNTFCPEPTSLGDFKRHSWHEGVDIVRANRGTRTYLGGMIEGGERANLIVVPTLATSAVPSGTIEASAYRAMRDTLLGSLAAAGPIDAICLSLHGAGVAQGVDDLEGELLAAVRAQVGPTMPIALTLDLHGNITERMGALTTGMFGVNFYPHTDMFERGVEAMAFLRRVLDGEIRPVQRVERLPMMIQTCTTDLEPGRRLNELCWAWEKKPGLLECAIFHGFPYTDVPPVAVSVVTIADGNVDLASAAAREVASAIWAAREEYRPRLLTPEQAIAEALAIEGSPVVINDTSDNPGGGAPGDATHLLRAMLAARLPDSCFGVVCDPETARQAHAAGAGSTIAIRLGGKSDGGRGFPLHGLPIEARARVVVLTDGRFKLTTPMGRGSLVDLGPSARLDIEGLDVIVSTNRQQVFDDEVFRLHGIDVRARRVVGVKSSNHFRAGFAHLAKAIVTADAPGATTLSLDGFPYSRIPRPIWPLDDEATYG
ncbi:MAG: M81 family peptidase [Chloroflexota bacterium]|nr:MAG: M81 family peptidase [Chloroflexota bacterium]